jgi:MFS family permease
VSGTSSGSATATAPEDDLAGQGDRWPLRRHRDFSLLWCGQTVSALGSATSVLAFPLLVLEITGSAIQAGAVGTTVAIVRAVFRLPGGALADRWNRRKVMLTCDAGRIVLFSTLAVVVATGQATLALIVAIAVTAAVLDVLFQPAAMAAVSQLVPAEQLPAAFGRNEAGIYAASLAGPPLGGALFGIARSVPFAFDALSYVASFVTLTAIRRPLQGERAQQVRQPLTREIRAGITYVRNSDFLRALILLFAFVDFAFLGAMFTVVVVLRQAGNPAGVVGLAQAVIAIGGLLGAFAASWLQRHAPFRRLIKSTTAILCVCMAVSAVLSGRLIMVLPVSVALFLAPALNAAIFSQLAATTPEHLQGRIISVVIFSSGAAASFAPLTMGLLINHLGGTVAMAVCAVVAALSVLTALTSRGLKPDTGVESALSGSLTHR